MLSVSIIVKNEEQLLDKCLASLKGVDEIIVVDTGSTDNTVEIAKKYTDKLYFYKWNDSFADARNYALKHCTGDWVISIDADEYVEDGEIEKIKKTIENIGDFNAISVKMIYEPNPIYSHTVPRIFKRPCEWHGDLHEYISCNAKTDGIKFFYKSGPSHEKDPDRNQRILLKELKKDPTNVRAMYYLGHDYFDRKDYETALHWYDEYLKIGTWRYEKSDVYLKRANCLFILQRGDEARDSCLQAILLNPNFKEALLYMATLSWEKEAKVWRKFAKVASNEDVLFIRGT